MKPEHKEAAGRGWGRFRRDAPLSQDAEKSAYFAGWAAAVSFMERRKGAISRKRLKPLVNRTTAPW